MKLGVVLEIMKTMKTSTAFPALIWLSPGMGEPLAL